MSDLNDDLELLSGDFRQKDDDLDDGLDDQLLYSSDDEKNDILHQLSSNESQPCMPERKIIEKKLVGRPPFVNTADSDSEGTDTKDEADDRPLNEDDSTRMNIKIFKTVPNILSDTKIKEIADVRETHQVATENISKAVSATHTSFEEDSDDDRAGSRDRFRSERVDEIVNIATRRFSSDKRDIPETLEISKEAKEKIELFNKQQKEKKIKRFHGNILKHSSTSRPKFVFGLNRGTTLHSCGIRGSRQHLVNSAFRGNRPLQQSILGKPPPNMFALNEQKPSYPMSLPLYQPWFRPGNAPPLSAFPSQFSAPMSGVLPLPPAPQQVLHTMTSQSVNIETTHTLALTNLIPIANNNLISNQENEGNPIPTVVSHGKRDNSSTPILIPSNTEDFQISANSSSKISRSSSESPVPANTKRIVLKPRRLRSRSPKQRSSRKQQRYIKRSRRCFQSYSPRHRSKSRSRSYSSSPKRRSFFPLEKNTSVGKPGKILINPHFKGSRNLNPFSQSTTNVTTTHNTFVSPIINPSVVHFPPPSLPNLSTTLASTPHINVNIPPPQVSSSIAMAATKVPLPITIPPPAMPPSVGILPPPDLNIPPPILDISRPKTAKLFSSTPLLLPARPNMTSTVIPPPPSVQLSNSSAIKLPIVVPPVSSHSNLPIPSSVNTTCPPPQFLQTNSFNAFHSNSSSIYNPSISHFIEPIVHQSKGFEPSVFIRPASKYKHTFTNIRSSFVSPQPTSENHSVETLPCTREYNSIASTQSRLKPPPRMLTTKNPSTNKTWHSDLSDSNDYQHQLQLQAEKRKKILALKAQRRGKGQQHNTLVAVIQGTSLNDAHRTVKISNLASVTNQDSIIKLMNTVGPFDMIKSIPDQRCFIVSFKSSLHAKEFTEKYNRYLLDLSCISVTLTKD